MDLFSSQMTASDAFIACCMWGIAEAGQFGAENSAAGTLCGHSRIPILLNAFRGERRATQNSRRVPCGCPYLA